jgi:hypothetical protein
MLNNFVLILNYKLTKKAKILRGLFVSSKKKIETIIQKDGGRFSKRKFYGIQIFFQKKSVSHKICVY